jgi:tetratricopeptide (TPR) repeat protein
MALSAGQPALEALESVVQRQQDGAAAQSLAIGYLIAGQPEAALQAIQSLHPATHMLDWRPLLRAVVLHQLTRTGEALEALEIGAQDPVIRPWADALAGKFYEAVGDRGAAVAAWNRALGARPQEAGWHHSLASLYLAGGSLDVALPHLQQAVEQAPGEMTYRLRLAKVLAGSGHGAEAVASYKLVLDRTEPPLPDLLEAGETALAAQSPEQAFEWFERAHAAAPQDPRGLVGSARAAMALGKNRKARERIDLALKAAPNDPEVRLGQGEILAMQRDHAAALQALDQIRGLSGAARSRLIQAKSRSLMALGQGELAEQGLLTELEQADQDPGLWFPLAQIRQARGDMAAAAEAAVQAVRLAPLNPDYRLGLARICRQAGNLDRALDELGRARELAPTDPRVPLEQGAVYEDRRDYRHALEAFRRAIELDPRCTQAYFRSGLVLKMLKSYPQAGQMLKRAAELAPIDREVMHQLAAVRALELVHGPATGAVH